MSQMVQSRLGRSIKRVSWSLPLSRADISNEVADDRKGALCAMAIPLWPQFGNARSARDAQQVALQRDLPERVRVLRAVSGIGMFTDPISPSHFAIQLMCWSGGARGPHDVCASRFVICIARCGKQRRSRPRYRGIPQAEGESGLCGDGFARGARPREPGLVTLRACSARDGFGR